MGYDSSGSLGSFENYGKNIRKIGHEFIKRSESFIFLLMVGIISNSFVTNGIPYNVMAHSKACLIYMQFEVIWILLGRK